MKRPKARGGCQVEGVCPFVSCRHHLLVDVNELGTLNMPGQKALSLRDRDPGDWLDVAAKVIAQAGDTCSLDIADRGEHTLEEVGEILGVTRERVRQIEAKALRKLREAPRDAAALRHSHRQPRSALERAEEMATGLPSTKRLREGIVRLEQWTLDLASGKLRRG